MRSEALYVDDELRFVEGARAAGMQSIQYCGLQEIIAAIQQFILSEKELV